MEAEVLQRELLKMVLGVLDQQPEGWASNIRAVSREAGLNREVARAGLRLARERGLAVFCRGLFTEDGEVAGAGYSLTREGRAWLKRPGAPEGWTKEEVREGMRRMGFVEGEDGFWRREEANAVQG